MFSTVKRGNNETGKLRIAKSKKYFLLFFAQFVSSEVVWSLICVHLCNLWREGLIGLCGFYLLNFVGYS